MGVMPPEYIGREQAFVKHKILKSYLQRLFMIIGRSDSIPVINYVDCFAGPWQENDEKLSDTSIGISLQQIESCCQGLKDTFHKDIQFRALYIEKNPSAYKKLENFLANNPHKGIEVQCLEGDYTDLLDEIVDWCGRHFTFFFVDPKGWMHVGAKTMQPLLQLPKSEFLITLMYDFVNRAATIAKHEKDMIELFGKVPDFSDSSPKIRKETQLQLYRNAMNEVYKGRTTFVPIDKPGKDRVHYFLIYLTRNAIGLSTFKEDAEKLEILKSEVHHEVKLRSKSNKTKMDDLFADDISHQPSRQSSFSKGDAIEYLESKLSKDPIRIDHELWADFLEESDLYPSDLQCAMKELVDRGVVENLDADVSKRRKKIIKPGYFNKSERWRIR